MEGYRAQRQLIETQSVAEFIPQSLKVASRGAKLSVSWTCTTYSTGSNWWQVLSKPPCIILPSFRPQKIPFYRPTNLDPKFDEGEISARHTLPPIFISRFAQCSLTHRLPSSHSLGLFVLCSIPSLSSATFRPSLTPAPRCGSCLPPQSLAAREIVRPRFPSCPRQAPTSCPCAPA